MRPPAEADCGGCSPRPGSYPRPPPSRREGAVGAAKGRARVGSDRGWRASVRRSRRGPWAVPGWLSARGTSASARRCHARPRVAAPAARASRSAEAGAARRRPGPKMLRARGLSALTARSGRAAPVRASSWGRAVAWPAGWVCLVSSSPLPFLPPSSVLSSLLAHSLGCCETSPLLRSRLPATASSNEHLCLAFNGPLLLSLLLSARFVDVVGSVL